MDINYTTIKSVIHVLGFFLTLTACCSKILKVLFCSSKCKLIFLPTDAAAFSSAHFGAGIGPIHLDEVGCTGNEATLISCRHASHQQFQCRYGHWEDAGVRCQSMSHDIYLYWVIYAFVV